MKSLEEVADIVGLSRNMIQRYEKELEKERNRVKSKMMKIINNYFRQKIVKIVTL